MTAMDDITARLTTLLDGAEGFSARVLFDFGEGRVLHVDGTKGPIALATEEGEADCIIAMPPEVFARILRGELDESAAFMSGDMQLKGEIGLATRISDFLRARAQVVDGAS
jgi:putative sterol carrier protein